MSDRFDPYKTLQVDPEAELEVIEAAYRRLARKYHPDVTPGPEAASRMVALNRAWELLRDPGRRAAVDRQRLAAQPRPADRPAAAYGPTAHGGPTNPGQPSPGAGAGHRASPSPGARDAPGFGDPARRRPETISRDWSSGRSSIGGGYDPSTMRAPDGTGAAGPPPGSPSGSMLRFGRYDGWSLGEIARTDLEYLEWLDRMPIGRPYRDEIDALLRRTGRRRSAQAESGDRRGLFRRR